MRNTAKSMLFVALRAASTVAALALALASCAPMPDAPGFAIEHATAPDEPDPTMPVASAAATVSHDADFLNAAPSTNARRIADWVVRSGDNGTLPFAIIDKLGAKVYVFDIHGKLQGATFALLGLAFGDGSAPGIGSARLSAIKPAERTTPAGRIIGQQGLDAAQSVFWIDYGDAIAMHPVVRGSPGDHRFARLATLSPLDKRITFGCVNVPANFYYDVVVKTFSGAEGVIYVLPDSVAIGEIFPQLLKS